MSGFVYKNAPQNILHSWVEVYFEDKWYEAGGVYTGSKIPIWKQVLKNAGY